MTFNETFSPHTRGWTVRRRREHPPYRVFPAHAGMDRMMTNQVPEIVGFPRTRGDGPTNLCQMIVEKYQVMPLHRPL